MTTNPLSPYAVGKLAAEQYCRLFYPLYGFETVALRYFNVFGPRQDPTSQYSAVIPKFITALLHDQPITIHGDGEQSRDFTYIDNVVQANLRACTAPAAPGQVFNIACGERHSLLQLVDTVAWLTGKNPQVQHIEGRAGDVPHSLADIDRARTVLGYTPEVKFVDGLAQTVDSFK
jgi:UDP-glucose 4-epimerase